MPEKITQNADGSLNVPDEPIIPFIEGDGTGVDIWPAAKHVLDAAIDKSYAGRRRVAWTEVLAGEEAFREPGSWPPYEPAATLPPPPIGHKAPPPTPVGAGARCARVRGPAFPAGARGGAGRGSGGICGSRLVGRRS